MKIGEQQNGRRWRQKIVNGKEGKETVGGTIGKDLGSHFTPFTDATTDYGDQGQVLDSVANDVVASNRGTLSFLRMGLIFNFHQWVVLILKQRLLYLGLRVRLRRN